MEKSDESIPTPSSPLNPNYRSRLKEEQLQYLKRLGEGNLPSVIESHLKEAVLEIEDLLNPAPSDAQD